MGWIRRSGDGGLSRQGAWEAALERHDAAMRESGLPECSWATEWEQADFPLEPNALRHHVDEYQRHVEGCAVCRARNEYAEKHLPPLPEPPLPFGTGVLGRVFDALGRLPGWARHAVLAGGVMGAVSVAQVLYGLVTRGVRGDGPDRPLLGQVGGVVAAAGWAGLGGAVFGLLKKPFRRLGRAGPYLAAATSALACAAPYPLVATLLSEDFSYWAVGVILGLLLSETDDREESDGHQPAQPPLLPPA